MTHENLSADALEWKTKATGYQNQMLFAQDEYFKLCKLISELLDTELGELACAGSDAPVEDVLGRMKIAIGA